MTRRTFLWADYRGDRENFFFFSWEAQLEKGEISPFLFFSTPPGQAKQKTKDGKKKRTGRLSVSRKSLSLDHIMVPNTVFGLSKTPFHSFQRHGDDMLALSWSKSWMTQTSRDALMFAEALRKQLLSSSMDKQFKVSKKEAFNKGSWGKSASRCNHLLLGSNYLG